MQEFFVIHVIPLLVDSSLDSRMASAFFNKFRDRLTP